MATEEVSLKERLKEARLRTAAERRETVSQERMGELVGQIVGRRVHQATWSEYENGKSEPPLDVFRAAARLSKLSFLYLTLGQEEEDVINPETDRKLTEEEIERARRVASAEREATQPRGKARKRRGS